MHAKYYLLYIWQMYIYMPYIFRIQKEAKFILWMKNLLSPKQQVLHSQYELRFFSVFGIYMADTYIIQYIILRILHILYIYNYINIIKWGKDDKRFGSSQNWQSKGTQHQLIHHLGIDCTKLKAGLHNFFLKREKGPSGREFQSPRKTYFHILPRLWWDTDILLLSLSPVCYYDHSDPT